MDERGETEVIAHGLDRAPAQIIAEIGTGVARWPRIDAAAERSAQQLRSMRAESHGVRTETDRTLAHARLGGVGPQQGDGVASPGLDPDMGGAVGEAEH